MFYVCGCSDKGSMFIFCATHALSTKREQINAEWSKNYTSKKWSDYKAALVKGLKLEGR